MTMTEMVTDRLYLRGSVVDWEEDIRHEFKGHRTISLEDRMPVLLPHHIGNPGELLRTRQQWSKVGRSL